MSRYIFILSILTLALFSEITRAAEPACTSVESASYQRTAAPGALMSAFGSGFPAMTAITAKATEFPLPTTLEGVSLLVDGVPAPLLYVGVGGPEGGYQINYQLPWEAKETATVEVFYNGVRVGSESLTVSTAAPGLFSVDASGAGQALAQNYRGHVPLPYASIAYTPNSASNPIAQGDVLILFGSGIGKTVDQSTGLPANPATGLATDLPPLYITPTLPIVKIGEKEAQVLFSGLVPGFTGLWQINVKIIPGIPGGPSVPVEVIYNGKSTRAGIYVAVEGDFVRPLNQ